MPWVVVLKLEIVSVDVAEAPSPANGVPPRSVEPSKNSTTPVGTPVPPSVSATLAVKETT